MQKPDERLERVARSNFLHLHPMDSEVKEVADGGVYFTIDFAYEYQSAESKPRKAEMRQFEFCTN